MCSKYELDFNTYITIVYNSKKTNEFNLLFQSSYYRNVLRGINFSLDKPRTPDIYIIIYCDVSRTRVRVHILYIIHTYYPYYRHYFA